MSSRSEYLVNLNYSNDDIAFETTSRHSLVTDSRFDRKLQKRWTLALEKGYFRYPLNIIEQKILPGKYGFFAQLPHGSSLLRQAWRKFSQLNPERGKNRRVPQEIASLCQPFNPNEFNFTKAKERELLFRIGRRPVGAPEPDADARDLIYINVSPLEYCNSLLVPRPTDCLPQVATVEGIRRAVELVLLSHTPALRVGFNSLCGFASVNHLHFHLYYLENRMLLEHIGVRYLAGPVYELVDYPGKGFALQLSDSYDTLSFARSVHRLTDYFQRTDTAHNIMITRGTRFEEADLDYIPATYDAVRVYVWARKSSSGSKDSCGFNPAMCELFGHLNIKDEVCYNELLEDVVAEVLADTCDETFAQRRDEVRELFSW